MSKIKIEFPADDNRAASIFGQALLDYSRTNTVDEPVSTHTLEDYKPAKDTMFPDSEATPIADLIPPPPSDIVPPITNADLASNLGMMEDSVIQESDVEVDAEGIPWDKRIHATTKTKTVKGVWKIFRRNKEKFTEQAWEDYITQVKTELTNPPIPIDTPTDTGVDTIIPPITNVTDNTTTLVTTFADLMNVVIEKQVPVVRINEICEKLGIEGGINGVNAAPEKIPTFHQELLS